MRQDWPDYRAIIVALASEEKKRTQSIILVHGIRTLTQNFRTSAVGGPEEKEREQG